MQMTRVGGSRPFPVLLVMPLDRLARLDTGLFAIPALAPPCRCRADRHSDDEGQQQEQEKWPAECEHAVIGTERIERQGDDLSVGDSQHDEKRSEEHTSELQSLMRISYAVFCLKKKIHTRTHIECKTFV